MFEIHLPSTDSTNTYAKQHVSLLRSHPIACITAGEQTAGRGRFQRRWISPPHVNLYVTFYTRLSIHQLHLSTLGLVLASSMARVLLAAGIHPQIKWPNDLQLNQKKFGGILCETVQQGEFFDVFAGIGVNVNMEAEDLRLIGQPATSLKQETKKTWDRKQLLQNLQVAFAKDLESFTQAGFAPFLGFCNSLLAYKGKEVRLLDGQREWTGICHSLLDDGRLQIQLPDHSLHACVSGEVSLREVAEH